MSRRFIRNSLNKYTFRSNDLKLFISHFCSSIPLETNYFKDRLVWITKQLPVKPETLHQTHTTVRWRDLKHAPLKTRFLSFIFLESFETSSSRSTMSCKTLLVYIRLHYWNTDTQWRDVKKASGIITPRCSGEKLFSSLMHARCTVRQVNSQSANAWRKSWNKYRSAAVVE